MMPSFCELCGRKLIERKMSTVIDGVVLNVCKGCSKHGKPYSSTNQPTDRRFPQRPTIVRNTVSVKANIQISDNIVLTPDFARLIREARMKKGLTHDQLAAQMNEKANLLKKFETGSLKPDQIIARKLARYLGIQLYENSQE